MRAILIVLLALFAAPATANGAGPLGIAFAQAEEGTFLCRNEDAAEALSCAVEQCNEQALGQECLPTAWCFPARWSGTMVVFLEDFHTTQVLCGAPTEAALTQALAALCVGAEAPANCEVVTIIDPDGNERSVEGVSFQGAAADLAPEDAAPEMPAEAEPAVDQGPEPAQP